MVAAAAVFGGLRPLTASLISRFEPVCDPYQRFRPTIPTPPPSSLFETSQADSVTIVVFEVPSVMSRIERQGAPDAVMVGCRDRMNMPFACWTMSFWWLLSNEPPLPA